MEVKPGCRESMRKRQQCGGNLRSRMGQGTILHQSSKMALEIKTHRFKCNIVFLILIEILAQYQQKIINSVHF